MKDLAGKKITARVVAGAVIKSGAPLLVRPSGPIEITFPQGDHVCLHLPPNSAVSALEGLEEVREPISTLPIGTFVEVTRINVGDDEAPAHLKGWWRGIVLGGEVLRLLDLSITDPAVFPWRNVLLDNIVEWKVVE